MRARLLSEMARLRIRISKKPRLLPSADAVLVFEQHIDKDGDKKEPMKKAAKDAKKKKMSMDEKVQLLNIGKQIREMAKQHGVQPSQFLGYLVAKNPEKYGPLAKLEDIIDGKG